MEYRIYRFRCGDPKYKEALEFLIRKKEDFVVEHSESTQYEDGKPLCYVAKFWLIKGRFDDETVKFLTFSCLAQIM